MKIKKYIFLSLIFCALYYLFLYEPFELIEEIPSIFTGQDFNVRYANSTTWIERNNEAYHPIAHDDKAIYILNGAGNDITDYKIDYQNKEILLKKNIMNLNSRRKNYFQLITIPREKYESIIRDNKIDVRIDYGSLGVNLLEYDYKTQQVKIIQNKLVGK